MGKAFEWTFVGIVEQTGTFLVGGVINRASVGKGGNSVEREMNAMVIILLTAREQRDIQVEEPLGWDNAIVKKADEQILS